MRPAAVLLISVIVYATTSDRLEAAAYDTAWVRTFGRTVGSNEYPRAIKTDSGGNVYVTGFTDSSLNSRYDYATVKYDPDGNLLWSRFYNYPGVYGSAASAMYVDPGGDVYVTGESYGASWDYATLKYNSSGVTQWTQRFDGPFSDDHAYDVLADQLGNVYVAGCCNTVKYSPTGAFLWRQTTNGARKVRVDANGNVFVGGHTDCLPAGTSSDLVTLQFNSAGALQWTGCYDGAVHSTDQIADLEVDPFGNVYVAGSLRGVGYQDDYVLLKYSPSGTLLWDRTFGTAAKERVVGLELDNDANAYVVGNAGLVKYDPDGNQLWVAPIHLGGRFSPSDMAIDKSGTLGIAGTYTFESDLECMTVGVDSVGSVLWSQRYPYTIAPWIAAGRDGTFFVLGRSSDLDTDFLIVGYSPRPCDDADNDGTCDIDDKCPGLDNPWQLDDDHDGVGNECDNCPTVPNPDQQDTNGNGIGDACDSTCFDSDGDGYADPDLTLIGCPPDNCPAFHNVDQVNCYNAGDPVADGVVDVLDVIRAIDVSFRGVMPDPDSTCSVILVSGSDVNCDSVVNALDVVRVIDVAFRGVSNDLCKPCLCDCYPTSCPELAGISSLLPNNGSFERHCHGTLSGWDVLFGYGSVYLVNVGAPGAGTWSAMLRGSWGGAGELAATVENVFPGGIYRLSLDFRPYENYYGSGAFGLVVLQYGSHSKYTYMSSDSTWTTSQVIDTLPIDQSGPYSIRLIGDNSQFPADGLVDNVILEYLGQTAP